MRLVNRNPVGDVEFPLLRRVIKRGEEFEVSDELGAELLKQAGNYEIAKSKAKTSEKGE